MIPICRRWALYPSLSNTNQAFCTQSGMSSHTAWLERTRSNRMAESRLSGSNIYARQNQALKPSGAAESRLGDSARLCYSFFCCDGWNAPTKGNLEKKLLVLTCCSRTRQPIMAAGWPENQAPPPCRTSSSKAPPPKCSITFPKLPLGDQVFNVRILL